MKECKDINFIGSVEARDIPAGVCDVIVCEAFVGNVILKLYEGTSSALIRQVKKGMMSTLRSKIGALLVKPALKNTLKTFDASQYGGAPMLGLKGLVVKTHGSATSKEIKHAIFQCTQFSKERINEKIKEHILEETELGGTIMELEKLQKIIAEVMNVDEEEITMDTTFVDDLGADSLDVYQIIMGIEEEFDIEIPNEEAEKIISVGDAVEAIKNAIDA